ncbi:class I SAM-dependent methyltransferase [Achromobacter aloeverae]|uniref:Methyltransferase n=1 Tax=Achromobacter aloeverae TaxID=1750518 RepID=A0A4Q1HEW5_9BURK|nr:class I SAM-dependent methyltransferase [Achromobacter aloeverae]RXN85160.1 methyltransferase [Achromobacter aloeverae]
MAAVETAYFQGLYAGCDDPWGLSTRWYEARKRALLLASLPNERWGRVFEPGCANGVLTLDLAGRADHVLASDLSQRALDAARLRLDAAGMRNVVLRRAVLPEEWPVAPEERFDLIVLSELGYYFDARSWACLATRVMDCLAPGGTIVACHWLHDFAERRLDTHAVHGAIARLAGLFPLVDHAEQDFLLQVWSRDSRSLARREGLA